MGQQHSFLSSRAWGRSNRNNLYDSLGTLVSKSITFAHLKPNMLKMHLVSQIELLFCHPCNIQEEQVIT